MAGDDWPPVSSAWSHPDGTRKYGSTGQLWEVRNGAWWRIGGALQAVEPAAPPDRIGAVVEYIHRDMANGEFWLDFRVDGQPYASVGPFTSEAERQRARDDMLGQMRAWGAKDLPSKPQ